MLYATCDPVCMLESNDCDNCVQYYVWTTVSCFMVCMCRFGVYSFGMSHSSFSASWPPWSKGVEHFKTGKLGIPNIGVKSVRLKASIQFILKDSTELRECILTFVELFKNILPNR